MKYLLLLSRAFFGIGIIGIGAQQIFYREFRPFIIPFWPAAFPSQSTWAYIAGAILILAGILICLIRNARLICLLLAIFFFVATMSFHLYDQLVRNKSDFQLGSWTNFLKELAFSGGSLIIAASYAMTRFTKSSALLLTMGRIFFSVMLIAFGIDHFLYTDFVATLVPAWFPKPVFWTYFGAVALIGAGLCVLLKIRIRLVSTLLGIMLLLWFALLHVPRALAAPITDKGNELTSVFQALAFSGVAFAIACIYQNRARSAVM
jgi:uncharacterized membrane protein YphA (DoxX/SURF4 family)